MRILYMGEFGLCLANVSIGIYNDDDKTLWFSIADSTLEKSEIIVENVNASIAEDILRELYTTQMYDFSTLGLHIQVC